MRVFGDRSFLDWCCVAIAFCLVTQNFYFLLTTLEPHAIHLQATGGATTQMIGTGAPGGSTVSPSW